METVANLGSYSNIGKQLELLKTAGLSDKRVASLVRKTLSGDKIEGIGQEEKTFIAGFTFLLFGCEVRRNPAALIIHQMVLDLIEYNNQTWKKYLSSPDGTIMPMVLKHSSGFSFSFISKSNSPYYLEGAEQSISADFYKSHAAIMNEWSRYKSGINNSNDMLDIKTITSQIERSLNNWYPELISLPLHSITEPLTPHIRSTSNFDGIQDLENPRYQSETDYFSHSYPTFFIPETHSTPQIPTAPVHPSVSSQLKLNF